MEGTPARQFTPIRMTRTTGPCVFREVDRRHDPKGKGDNDRAQRQVDGSQDGGHDAALRHGVCRRKRQEIPADDSETVENDIEEKPAQGGRDDEGREPNEPEEEPFLEIAPAHGGLQSHKYQFKFVK
jgi:hypothetical protein